MTPKLLHKTSAHRPDTDFPKGRGTTGIPGCIFKRALMAFCCFHCLKIFQFWVSKTGKTALERFSMHEKSDGHKLAVTTAAHANRPVTTHLSSAVSMQQAENRANLLKIIGGEMFLARQGLAFRGHDHHEGNHGSALKIQS
ncbi:hypothetical protein N1851_008773 [Merluccius polli]|uniref:DUF4371 domain-containing protein n=1 Tax=Merluccius polli TaxID=89951 RepID=A0AA47N289_MERPO|nr:hypothetical protein N1851_008773 [Merluccius polli]